MKRIMKFSPRKVLSTGFVMLAALATATPQTQGSSCTPPPAGLVSWWPGEGNANDVVGGNNGAWAGTGSLNTYAPGMVSQAFVFDGTHRDRVDVGNPTSLQLQDFTIETWVKRSSATVASLDENFADGSIAGPGAFIFGYGAGGYGLFLFDTGEVGLTKNSDGDTHVPPAVTDTNWHHVAVAKSGTNVVFYVDGVLQPTPTPSPYTSTFLFTSSAAIGSRGDGGGNTFYGKIDELSIYNRALFSNEISAIYNASSAGKCAPAQADCVTPPAGIVGWWKADGSTVDSAGGNNGVNQNISYTNGVVGQAFACDPENYTYGTYTGIQAADRPAYALTNALTIETWVRPRGDGYLIFFRGDHRPGMDPYYLSMQANNVLRFGVCDAAGNSAFVETTVNYFAWTHVSATLDGAAGTLNLYTNGVLAAQTVTAVRPFANLLSNESPGIGIGNVNDGGNNFPFFGDIDEISLYNRALSQAEIQSIYNAGSAGKCTSTPPLAT